MTRRRLLLGLTLLAAVAIGVYMALLLTAPIKHQINPEQFERIQRGMTKAEVVALLGVPAGDYSRLEAHWDVAYEYLPGKHEFWHADTFSIFVSFDDHDRVLSKADFTRRRVGESTLDKLRRWLGIR